MKQFIKNRKGQNVCVVTNVPNESKGLVFIVHGLGSNKERPTVKTFKKSFQEENFTTVIFDVTNSSGESDGDYKNATTTNFYEDLEDVISWAKKQNFYQEPFWLIGHSLGGLAVARYCYQYPNKIKSILLASPTINVKWISKTSKDKLQLIDSKTWRISKNQISGETRKLDWDNFIGDLKDYDLKMFIKNLKKPILIISGENELYCNPLNEIASSLNLDFKIIKSAPHSYREKEHLKQLKQIIKEWIKKTLK